MEKTILVGVEHILVNKDITAEESIEELKMLSRTANAKVFDTVIQKLKYINPKTFIGTGKAKEISDIVKKHNLKSVIFDFALTPAQQRNLEDIIKAKIIDRPRLILDIFAKRAKTVESKLQVELAQLEYLLPRLTGKGISMMQQVGGIGTRGPGEKQLEYDRRKIRERIKQIKKKLKKTEKSHKEQRKKRKANKIPIVSLVGYTNAGKSTLMNAMSKSNVYTEDKLFATLTTTTRKVYLGDRKFALLSDTVGFIRNIPHQLIESFKTTLKELEYADLILHVIDVSNPLYLEQKKVVEETLKELNLIQIPIWNILNKTDLVFSDTIPKKNYILTSALKGNGIEELKKRIKEYFYG